MRKIIYALVLAGMPLFLFAQQSDKTSLPYATGQAVATISNPLLEEISGLAFSRKHPNLIYVQTDSGGEAAVYLLDSLGNELGKLELEGVENRDWEEIAVGPGPNGQSYVYVGEIGDNLARHDEVIVYRFPEPNRIQSGKVTVEAAILTYPKGPRDAETMMVDPLDGRIYILSKRDVQNSIYSFDQEAFRKSGETEMEAHFNLPFTMSTAGDISADGSKILIKNYQSIFYWEREEGEDLLDVLKRDPIELPYNPEPQGEAIGFGPSGATFYTLSEKRFSIEPVLYCYPSTR